MSVTPWMRLMGGDEASSMRTGTAGLAGGSGQKDRGQGGEEKGGSHQEEAVAISLEKGLGAQHAAHGDDGLMGGGGRVGHAMGQEILLEPCEPRLGRGLQQADGLRIDR